MLANYRVMALPSLSALEQFITTEMVEAALIGGTQTFPFTCGVGEILEVEGSNDGGVSWGAFNRYCTISAAGPHADIAAILTELNTAGRWNGGSLPTEFVISNSGNKLVITHAINGTAYGLRVSGRSTVIGKTSNVDLLFGANVPAFGTKYGSVGLVSVIDIFQDNSGQYILVYTV
jgi:hypothetical protein